MARAPRKYTDESRSEITPEWKAWYDKQVASIDYEVIAAHIAGMGMHPSIFYPSMWDKDMPEHGAWILVVEEPVTVVARTFRVPTPSLWFGVPEYGKRMPLPQMIGFKGLHTPPMMKVKINTPGGTLYLWPYEYTICRDPLALITDPDVTIHSLGGTPPIDEELLFYLQSRGLSRHDAAMLLLEQIDMSQWGWVEFPPDVTEFFRGVGAIPRFETRRQRELEEVDG